MAANPIANVDYVILLCEDIDRVRAFYRDVMGFSLENDRGVWVQFRVGSVFLTLRSRGPWQTWNDGPTTPGSVDVQLAF